jgi:hypothetical protein
MRQTHATFFCPLLLSIVLSTQPLLGQTQAPALETQFTLPLADKTTAQAVLLPTADGKVWLVYSTSTGQIGLWTMTPATSPSPPIPPTPPTPPIPPEPPKPVSVSVITVTETDPAPCPAQVADFLSANKSTYFAFTVAMVADKNPPANSLTWIGRTAGKSYPYSFVASHEGKTLWEGPTPTAAANFIMVIQSQMKTLARISSCSKGSCPTK